MCNTVPRPDGQLHASLKIKESHGSILKFLSYHSFGWKAKAITIKDKGAFEIIYAKGDYGDM